MLVQQTAVRPASVRFELLNHSPEFNAVFSNGQSYPRGTDTEYVKWMHILVEHAWIIYSQCRSLSFNFFHSKAIVTQV